MVWLGLESEAVTIAHTPPSSTMLLGASGRPVGPPGRDGPQVQVVFPGNLGFGRRAKTQVAPAEQVVRVMVWLGLGSWSTRPTGQAVRVIVWLD